VNGNVAAGVKYKQNPQDQRIFLALPQELRPLLREALGLEEELEKSRKRTEGQSVFSYSVYLEI
jgi:hypothetical protein